MSRDRNKTRRPNRGAPQYRRSYDRDRSAYDRGEGDRAISWQTNPRRALNLELEDFIRYLNSPWRILWRNLAAGLARGLGAIFGATVIVALAIWVLKIFIDLPLIGQYAVQIRAKVDEVAQETRYSDDFGRLQRTMDRIDLRLKTQNELLEKLLSRSSDVRENAE